jgi:serine/threonine-protein kinase
MRFCPRCKVSFPDGISRCPSDGARLVDLEVAPLPPAPAIEPTQSLAPVSDSFEAIVAAPAPPYLTPNAEGSDVTRAERPQARARGSSASHGVTPPPAPPGRCAIQPGERIGTVLGNYRLLDLIGQGGMGCVYQAEHVKLGRPVALKLLRDSHAERRDAVARFFQEARAVNKIRHRNIVDVTDFVELDDGTTFIIMELLDGASLGRLARVGELPYPRALALLIQICDGLAAAHRNGIVHRDLKPDNIIVVPTGDGADLVKLLDFGVAKLLHSEIEDLGYETAAGAVVGTPTFMSPEQAGGLDVDARADIYSLGAIMYEVFCGQPVFTGRSFGEFVRKHLNEPPIPPSQTPGGRHIDDRLEAIILRCLEKRPEDRYPTVLALREDLLRLLGAIETSVTSSQVLDSGSGSFPPAAGDPLRRSAPGLAPGDSGARAPGRDSWPGDPARSSSSRRAGATGPAGRSAGASASGLRADGPSGGASASGLRAGGASGDDLRASGAPVGLAASGTRAQRQSDVDGLLPGAGAAAGGAPSRRRWVAVVAVGGAALAIGAVGFYFATRSGSAASSGSPAATTARVEPEVTPVHPATGPIAVRPPVVRSEPIVLRFRSTPSAAVFPAGSAVKLCRTPCDLTINPDDGGSPTRRDFAFEQSGYRSQRVSVTLAELPANGLIDVTLRPARAGQPADPPAAAAPDDVEKVETRPPEPPEPPDPDPDPIGHERIDPTDTMDPFGAKRSR